MWADTFHQLLHRAHQHVADDQRVALLRNAGVGQMYNSSWIQMRNSCNLHSDSMFEGVMLNALAAKLGLVKQLPTLQRGAKGKCSDTD